MWTLLRLHDRNRFPAYTRRAARGRVAHYYHGRAALNNDPLVGCCNSTDKIVMCGTVSIAIGILSVIYATYEMHKAGEFYDHNAQIPIDNIPVAPAPAQENTSTERQKLDTTKYYDKYGSEISKNKLEYLLGQEQLDKGLCVSLTFLGIIQVVSSGLLIRGAKIRDKRSYVPWMVIATTLMSVGLIYVLFNIVTLFHCLKNVLRSFKGETNGNQLHEGMAIFDARNLSNDVFTITNGQMRPADSPVRIVLKPPSYDEAMSASEDLGPPPDPPDEEGKESEKPPEYTP